MQMIQKEGRGVDRLSRPGRAGHRPAQQAQGVRAPGSRAPTPSRPTSGSASRPTCATTASARRSCSTSGCKLHPPDHQQSAQDGRPRGLRPARRRARADRAAGERRERRLHGHQARQARAPARFLIDMAEFNGIADRRGTALRRARHRGSTNTSPRSSPTARWTRSCGMARPSDDVDVVWVPGAWELPVRRAPARRDGALQRARRRRRRDSRRHAALRLRRR